MFDAPPGPAQPPQGGADPFFSTMVKRRMGSGPRRPQRPAPVRAGQTGGIKQPALSPAVPGGGDVRQPPQMPPGPPQPGGADMPPPVFQAPPPPMPLPGAPGAMPGTGGGFMAPTPGPAAPAPATASSDDLPPGSLGPEFQAARLSRLRQAAAQARNPNAFLG